MIEIFREAETPMGDDDIQLFADACIAVQRIQSSCLASLTLTDDEGIRRYNREWRNLDQATDVLSFPSLPLSPKEPITDGHPLLHESWDSETGAFFLGDIIISVPMARRQADEYGHSLRKELLYLLSHGLFHLMGYDHQNEEDKRRMREMEDLAVQTHAQNNTSDEMLLQAARQARTAAYAPYSNYRVGAALLGEEGRVYTGGNIENISYGLTNCAERTALFKAVSEGQRTFKTIAIAADATAPWPCGACRQVLSEFAPKLKVLITWGDGQQSESTLDRLLPNSFLHFQEDAN